VKNLQPKHNTKSSLGYKKTADFTVSTQWGEKSGHQKKHHATLKTAVLVISLLSLFNMKPPPVQAAGFISDCNIGFTDQYWTEKIRHLDTNSSLIDNPATQVIIYRLASTPVDNVRLTYFNNSQAITTLAKVSDQNTLFFKSNAPNEIVKQDILFNYKTGAYNGVSGSVIFANNFNNQGQPTCIAQTKNVQYHTAANPQPGFSTTQYWTLDENQTPFPYSYNGWIGLAYEAEQAAATSGAPTDYAKIGEQIENQNIKLVALAISFFVVGMIAYQFRFRT
jgi:hypothetical protein